MTEAEFEQLLEEQIKKQRSEEFEDIAYVFDQEDEKTTRETSWRILEQVFKAEKKKRGMDEEKAEGGNKKLKMSHSNEDCDLVVITSESSSGNEDCNDDITPCLKGDLNPLVGREGSSRVLDENLTMTETKDARKSVKKDLRKGWMDEERADIDTGGKIDNGDDNSDNDDNDDDDDDDDGYDKDDDNDVNSGSDDDDDVKPAEKEEKEESEQSLTYGK